MKPATTKTERPPSTQLRKAVSGGAHKKVLGGETFRLFEEPPLSPKPYDVVFHFRAVNKEGHDSLKNYSPVLADELAQKCLARGMSVACMGHPSYSYCPPGRADHRSVDLRQTVAAISSGRADQ